MKILVCVKHVPDTETRPKLSGDGQSLDVSGANFVISPYDEFGIEAALRWKEGKDAESEASGDVEAVHVVCIGPEAAGKTLRTALAMGADEARHVLVEEDLDPRATAAVLAAVAQKDEYGMIFAGKHAVGTDQQQVGVLLAENLGWPHVSVVVNLVHGTNDLKAKREIEGGIEEVKCSLPAVLTCQKGLNEPRYPSLRGIMQAKKKPMETWPLAEMSVPIDNESSLVGISLPPPREAGRLLEGEPPEQVAELVRILADEKKVLS